MATLSDTDKRFFAATRRICNELFHEKDLAALERLKFNLERQLKHTPKDSQRYKDISKLLFENVNPAYHKLGGGETAIQARLPLPEGNIGQLMSKSKVGI